MSRNKYPEETERKILDAALHLFMTKGYDNTSIQDIIDSLGGLTKGAVYHHFSSKEEILDAVMKEMDKEAYRFLQSVKENPSLTGYDKLKFIFEHMTGGEEGSFPMPTAPDMRKNPQMLSRQLASVYETLAPDFIQPMLEEGIADGSICTDYPRELAEIIALLNMFWLNPLICREGDSRERIIKRLEFFEDMMQKQGVGRKDGGGDHETNK